MAAGNPSRATFEASIGPLYNVTGTEAKFLSHTISSFHVPFAHPQSKLADDSSTRRTITDTISYHLFSTFTHCGHGKWKFASTTEHWLHPDIRVISAISVVVTWHAMQLEVFLPYHS